MTLAVSAAFALAREPGPSLTPTALLARAAAGPPGWAATPADDDALIQVLDGEFSYTQQGLSVRPSPAELDEWAALLRWQIAALRNWSEAADPEDRQLRAMLALTVYMAPAGDPWLALAHDLTDAPAFARALGRFISQFRLDPLVAEDAPTWEQDLIASFRAADQQQTWDVVAGKLPALLPAFRPPLMLAQASRALAFLSPPTLVKATANVESLLTALTLVAALPLQEALQLAAATPSERLQFAIVAGPVANLRSPLPPELEDVATVFLTELGGKPKRWPIWTRVLLGHPGRYPALLRPVGRALAQLPLDAAALALDTLPLEDHGDARFLAGMLFDALAEHAVPAHQRAVWAHAYQRWRRWDFGSSVLLGPQRCVCDYAVVRHLTDGLSAADARAAARVDRLAAATAQSAWRRNRSEVQMARHRAASSRLVHIWAWRVRRLGAQLLDPNPTSLPRAYRSPYRDLQFGRR